MRESADKIFESFTTQMNLNNSNNADSAGKLLETNVFKDKVDTSTDANDELFIYKPCEPSNSLN